MILPAKPFKLRFSIRAMLVVMTLLALWCGYGMNWIRQRREFMDSDIMTGIGGHTRAPGLLFLLGERGYSILHVDFEEGDPKIGRIQALFPEAECMGYETISRE
ncbi:hypothetical protein [Lacipirellula sp.]|uniref:hypothetical protein n=1 Tax=Lacipirellula sp. TaxID=2691419 RepID=UPI003D0D7AD6